MVLGKSISKLNCDRVLDASLQTLTYSCEKSLYFFEEIIFTIKHYATVKVRLKVNSNS